MEKDIIIYKKHPLELRTYGGVALEEYKKDGDKKAFLEFEWVNSSDLLRMLAALTCPFKILKRC